MFVCFLINAVRFSLRIVTIRLQKQLWKSAQREDCTTDGGLALAAKGKEGKVVVLNL